MTHKANGNIIDNKVVILKYKLTGHVQDVIQLLVTLFMSYLAVGFLIEQTQQSYAIAKNTAMLCNKTRDYQNKIAKWRLLLKVTIISIQLLLLVDTSPKPFNSSF